MFDDQYMASYHNGIEPYIQLVQRPIGTGE